MARTRSIDDESILQAVALTMAQLGPSRFTLVEVGKKVGLAPATLLQRFGSKRGLMLACVQQGAAMTNRSFRKLEDSSKSPLMVLRGFLVESVKFLGKPEEVGNHLAFLSLDLQDEDFGKAATEQAKAFHAGIIAMLKRSIQCGELCDCNADSIASQVEIILHGSLLLGAIRRDRNGTSYLTTSLNRLFDPLRVRGQAVR